MGNTDKNQPNEHANKRKLHAKLGIYSDFWGNHVVKCIDYTRGEHNFTSVYTLFHFMLLTFCIG
jgi:hypothetical protein